VRVTIVQNSNENARVHKAGCPDIERREKRDRGYLSSWDAEVSTQREAAIAAWSDHVAEKSMTEEAALGYTAFLPCCDKLPADDAFGRFMARFDPDGSRTVADITPVGDANGDSPFVVVRHGEFTAVIALIPLGDHLCIDVHPFVSGQDAAAGVFAIAGGHRIELPPTGRTSHGFPAVGIASVVIGKQGTEAVIRETSLRDGDALRVTKGRWQGFTGRVEHVNKIGSYKVRLDTTVPGIPGKLVAIQKDQAEPVTELGAAEAGELVTGKTVVRRDDSSPVPLAGKVTGWASRDHREVYVLWGTADTATAEACDKLAELSQAGPRYTAHITAEAWQGSNAVEVDAPGPQDWDCTAYAAQNPQYLARLAGIQRVGLDVPGAELTDNDDWFRNDPAAPAWVHAWRGPFTIRVTRQS